MHTRRWFMTTSACSASLALGLTAAPFAHAAPTLGRLILGFPAGGSNDAVARLLAQKMQGQVADSLIVENRAGGGGRLAVDAVRRMPADGTAILQTPGSVLTLYPHVYANLAYDALRDFVPVSTVCTVDFALVVGPGCPARTLQEFIAWCKANPQRASFGSPATGASPHFVGLDFARAAGLNLLHVGYRGSAQAVQELVGGQIPAYVGLIADVTSYLPDRKLRVLATSGQHRAAATPDVPTFKEAGFDEISIQEWYGILLPAGAPASVVASLNASLERTLRDSQVLETFKTLNVEPAHSTPAAFAERIRSERLRWGPIVAASGVKLTE